MDYAKHLGSPVGCGPTRQKPTGYILVIGQYLRNLLYAQTPALIKDRRYHLRLFTKCFIGKDVVDWLLYHENLTDRSKVVEMMEVLVKGNVIHHVTDDHGFKDDYLFYRFRLDDSSFVMKRENEPFIKGWQLFTKLSKSENPVSTFLQSRTESNISYEKCFYGSEMVDYLVRKGEVDSRQKAVVLGKDLLESEIIRHVTEEHHFKDEHIVYQFHPHLESIKLSDLLSIDLKPRTGSTSSCSSSPTNSYGILQKLPYTSNDAQPKVSIPRHASLPGTFDGMTLTSLSDLSLGKHLPVTSSTTSPSSSPSVSTDTKAPPSVLLRQATVEELMSEDSPYIRKTLTITSDSVGYGFIVRGNSPCYVQTVDPTGPAAAKGLKVRQYISSVNGHNCLKMSHHQIADLILKGGNQVALEVMIHFRDASKTT
ncbi:DEP domain-containing mTOR-interacting protein-like [Anneissia japonica]|uniref:DEP domain-containing mTOR-interacting protein-like n=1 Tax=Anneissia japonica TaxID=1529436 RepID=UPI001425B2AC|nr:DEP domain-containing mTOR-interacting protein-like [Anneissia japonica]XP_033104546.1 DEP domain-containing mTOR-interacting protein-like [Anneissia japonica]XP_033104547.1 DEP domain-containing mTOR-interacting protein-like [Anneissia japonica]XP_033104548.1 DEP domain-containing mTOR-interacting protein-like [Anneissia japonica]